MKWLISSHKRNEKSMSQKLAAGLAASKEEGAAVKKRVDTHKPKPTSIFSLWFNNECARDLKFTRNIGIAAHIDVENLNY